MKTQIARIERLEKALPREPEPLPDEVLLTNYLVSMRRRWDSWALYTKSNPPHSYANNWGITRDEADMARVIIEAAQGSDSAYDKAACELCVKVLQMPVREPQELTSYSESGLCDWQVWNSYGVDAVGSGCVWRLGETQHYPTDESE